MTDANQQSMCYYEVFVADSSYKSAAALTYQYPSQLDRGRLVIAPLKQNQVYGVVVRQVAKPRFVAKSLSLAPINQPLPSQLIDLAVWITTYYPSGMGITLQQFLPHKLYPAPEEYSNAQQLDKISLPPLTLEQETALNIISKPDTYILHGETGSGKTRVYLELTKRSLNAGRPAIIMTPEIGLTPQLFQTFQSVFGAHRVIVTHSQLTAKARSLLWSRIAHSTTPLVVLGPRSALFSPLRNVGLVVLDESHESSYKQEQAPHYHASKVASRLASLHKAVLVLGSATPSITDYFLAKAKSKAIVRMNQTAQASSPATTAVVDLTNRQLFNRQPHLSDALIASIQQSLAKNEQSLVFLNRRGTARIILCQQCSWQAVCPHCDLPLAYHGDSHSIRCHTCGFTALPPTSCPNCSSVNIILKSIGTKAIVDQLQSVFPEARIQRFDTDNSKTERLELHYDAIRNGDIDIIVGTQLIAKGLDLPLLSTVGVVIADTSLYLPDYSSSERSYQLLRQVIGRVGRGHRAGTVVIQTYDPTNPVIRAAIKGFGKASDQSWQEFYQTELKERQSFSFPPFVYTLKVWCRRASPKSAQVAADKAVALLRNSGLHISVDGPMPAFHEKAAGQYQWQAIVKAKDRQQLLAAIKILPANWSFDIDPNNLL